MSFFFIHFLNPSKWVVIADKRNRERESFSYSSFLFLFSCFFCFPCFFSFLLCFLFFLFLLLSFFFCLIVSLFTFFIVFCCLFSYSSLFLLFFSSFLFLSLFFLSSYFSSSASSFVILLPLGLGLRYMPFREERAGKKKTAHRRNFPPFLSHLKRKEEGIKKRKRGTEKRMALLFPS